MPFKSKSQVAACYAKNDIRWNCEEWMRETGSTKKLPARVPAKKGQKGQKGQKG